MPKNISSKTGAASKPVRPAGGRPGRAAAASDRRAAKLDRGRHEDGPVAVFFGETREAVKPSENTHRDHMIRVVTAIDQAAHAVRTGSPNAVLDLQAALRDVVVLYRLCDVKRVESDVASAARLHVACGHDGWSVVRDHELGFLNAASDEVGRLLRSRAW